MSGMLEKGVSRVFGPNRLISARQSANAQFCRAGNSIFYFILPNDPSLLLFEKSDYNLKSYLFSFPLPWVREPQLYNKRALVAPCLQDGMESFIPPDPSAIPTLFLKSVIFSLGSIR